MSPEYVDLVYREAMSLPLPKRRSPEILITGREFHAISPDDYGLHISIAQMMISDETTFRVVLEIAKRIAVLVGEAEPTKRDVAVALATAIDNYNWRTREPL